MSSQSLNELSELQLRTITDRIGQTERNMNVLIESIAAVNRKASRTRDRTDELAKVLKSLTNGESHNESTTVALDALSKAVVRLADIEDLKISRIEEKVIGELVQYEFLCRNSREEVKSFVTARDREIAKRKSIDASKKLRGHGTSENELMLNNIQLSKILKELLSLAESFERQKLADMKQILMNFVLIQLKFFASGLEVFGEAYRAVAVIDEKEDLEQFKKHLENETRPVNKFKFMRAFNMFSQSTSNLDRIGKREKRNISKSQSIMSLNSIDSLESDEARGAEKEEAEEEEENKRKSRVRIVDVDAKTTTDSDETDVDDSSTANQSDTITEDIPAVNQPTSTKNLSLTRAKHAR